MWERFFNWQSDLDWTWGPFLPLRPPRDVPMRPWVWVRLFAALSLAGSLFVALGGMICVFGPRVAARQHWAVPASLAELLATLTAMAQDPASEALLLGMAFSLPPVFFGACLPFHVAWNRRAARLSLLPPEVPKALEDVWPPAPNQR